MADLTNDIIQKIYALYRQNGYISENRVFDLIIDAGIPLDETDRVIDKILSMGVLIQDKSIQVKPEMVNEENNIDRTQLDYEEIYSRVLKIEPSLCYLIDYVRTIPAPKTHEMTNLMIQAKAGNEYARNRIIELMMKIAIKMALNFSERYGTDLDDTIQNALEGLIIAYEKFEIGKQDNFTTYAPWWIRQNLHRTIDICHGLHTPAHLDERLMLIRDLSADHFCDECDRHYICPRLLETIIEKLELPLNKILLYFRTLNEPISIEALIENESASLLAWENDDLNEEVAYWDMQNKLMDMLGTLSPREQMVLMLKYGLDDGKEKTLEEVGNKFNVTRERVRQLEAKALRKLRHPSRANILKDYIDIDFQMILVERYESTMLKKN